jgi:asparagine synthase (glutamine-hydrolysing)
MCGIAGFFETKLNRDSNEIRTIGNNMIKTLHHRGPDANGLWQDTDIPLLLAHARLSIIDLSKEGAQPMISASGRYVISYNGEVYNFPAIMSDLEDAGIEFRGRSDTEVILAAFEKWGISIALQKLNGMFAFALLDRKEKRLHLVRDRMGKKPLYIGWAGHALIFASELKAIHEHPSFEADISRDALSLFMRYAYVPAPFSIYKNMWQLPAGCMAAIDLEKIEAFTDLAKIFVPYWHHPRKLEEARSHLSAKNDNEIIDEFDALLKDCVRDRMISDVPLGAFLSGGIDSSMIVAHMQEISDIPVKTFSIGFSKSGFDEASYAKKIAAHIGTDHQELYLEANSALDVIPKLPDMYDEPFADPSQIPTYMISKFARQDVTVALSGDGGDEMLGGYLRHYTVPKIWNKVGWLPGPARAIMGKAITMVPVDMWDKVIPGHPQIGERLHKMGNILPLKTEEEIYTHLTCFWVREEPLVIDSGNPVIPLTDNAWRPEGLSFAERMMYGDTLSYLPNDILVKVDRASMANSLEVRAPLLDKRIFEYAWSLPHNVKIRNGKGKWLLRQTLARYVPEKMFERPKQGFAIPISDWLNGPLNNWANDLLSEESLKNDGFLNPEPVINAWQQHQKGKGNYSTRLWNVLMFNSWLSRWNK